MKSSIEFDQTLSIIKFRLILQTNLEQFLQKITPFIKLMNPSYDQLNDYTHYLQSQVQKFTSFMLTQKKLNEKHLQVQQSIGQFLSKLNKIDDKIKLIEISQKDNLLEIRKVKKQKQVVKTMELRLENIERQLSSILNIDSNRSFQHGSQDSSVYQGHSEQKNHKKEELSHNFHEKDLSQIEKYQTEVFVKRQDVEMMVNKTRDDLDFRIKKLQIQIDKSKESFLKLTNHINSLSANLSHQNQTKREVKNQNRVGTQSTKDLNVESMNHQNIVTKKQLKKMEKKLENFFSQKLSQMATQNLKKQQQLQGLAVQKALKFKKMQEKYDRMTLEHSNPRQTRSERKIELLDRQYSSQKKISLFDNQILKERHMNEFNENERKKRKSKSRSNKQSPIGMLDSEKYGKERKGSNSKSQVKRFGKKRSAQRLKKVNVDYMMH